MSQEGFISSFPEADTSHLQRQNTEADGLTTRTWESRRCDPKPYSLLIRFNESRRFSIWAGFPTGLAQRFNSCVPTTGSKYPITQRIFKSKLEKSAFGPTPLESNTHVEEHLVFSSEHETQESWISAAKDHPAVLEGDCNWCDREESETKRRFLLHCAGH